MAQTGTGEADRSSAPGSSVYGLALRVSLLLVAIMACAFFPLRFIGEELAGDGGPSGDGVHQFVIGNEVLAVPTNILRFASEKRTKTGERLELRLRWTGLDGAGENVSEMQESPEVDPALIFVVIEPRRMSLDMSGRVEPVYSKFLHGAETPAGNGLVKRALSDKAGFLDEDLYYEADNPYPFAARCIRAETRSATPFCLRDIHVGTDLTVTYRFHLSLIGQWMRLDEAIRQRIKGLLMG